MLYQVFEWPWCFPCWTSIFNCVTIASVAIHSLGPLGIHVMEQPLDSHSLTFLALESSEYTAYHAHGFGTSLSIIAPSQDISRLM